jgi:D-arabinose 1-dehydrogenase-like Zn-dependent alcohol dehydrogenase
VTPAVTLALIPDEVSAVDAGPLMCAGVTTFNSLRNSGVGPGEVVAVLGIGGLGHLGVQFAAKCGCNTVAIARGADKVELAKKLGAHVYIDSDQQDVAAELQKLGGAKTILATVTAGDAMSAAFGGLGIDGKLMVLGVPNTPIQVNAITAIFSRAGLRGWYSGRSIDSQDTLRFSALTGVRPMTQVFPLDKVNEAYGVMMNGTVRFRAVLKIGA